MKWKPEVKTAIEQAVAGCHGACEFPTPRLTKVVLRNEADTMNIMLLEIYAGTDSAPELGRILWRLAAMLDPSEGKTR